MFKMRNKKGEEILMTNVIFIVLTLVFFAAMFFFVGRAGSGASSYEQEYAKKIALLIDQAKPGTTVWLDISELVEKKNKNYKGEIVIIDYENNKVIVKLREGEGYGFAYFSDAEIEVLQGYGPENKFAFKVK